MFKGVSFHSDSSTSDNDNPGSMVYASDSFQTVHNMWTVGGIYRDRNGVEVEYVSVPLPTHEVTQAVPLAARMVGNRASRKERPFYEGTDGTELATQPRHHRKQWTEQQWVAFREFQKLELDMASSDEPIAATMIIKT